MAKNSQTQAQAFRIGGMSLILIGIILLVTLPLLAILTPILLGSDISSVLTTLHSLSNFNILFFGLLGINDILYIISFASLYLLFRERRGYLALLSLSLIIAAVAIDLATDIPLHFTILSIANSYLSSNALSQPSYLAAANLALSLGNIGGMLAQLPLSLAEILISYAMLSSKEFGSFIGRVGIIAGLLTMPIFLILSTIGSLIYFLGFLFNVIWSIAAGIKLYRYKL
ncbi:hypothetical protein M1394_01655 [Candidatus Marsarchaeota archaeon]|nr:hypothetical protein [Candidatus Marsarchaeota archaeon]